MGRVPLPGRPLLHDIVPGQFDPHRLHNHNLRSGHLTDLRCSIIVQSPPSCLSFSFEQCSHIQIALEPGDMRKMPRHFPAVGDCPEPAKRSGSPCGGTMRSGSASPGEFRSRPSSRPDRTGNSSAGGRLAGTRNPRDQRSKSELVWGPPMSLVSNSSIYTQWRQGEPMSSPPSSTGRSPGFRTLPRARGSHRYHAARCDAGVHPLPQVI
jgi:hypothetical protein